MSSHPWNIAVIGAGPAGSVAAISLAQLGHLVTLFEKATFPRDKVCGECLSATGIAVLERLGVANQLRHELRPVTLKHAAAVASDGSRSQFDLPLTMWGVTRRSMDRWLAARAAQAGVTIRLAAATPNFRSMTVSVMHGRDAPATEENHVAFEAIVIADGRGGSLPRTEPTGDFGIKAHFRDVSADRDTIELVSLTSGGYAGLAPVNGELWNSAWSVPASLLRRHRGDIDALFRKAVACSSHLKKRFAPATRVGEWLSCPLPRHAVRRDWPRNVIPIGNAAAALEPVGGEGMGLAMRSGELAAEAIDAAAREDRDFDSAALRKAFDRLWKTRSAACRGAAVVLSHPIVGPLAVEIARRSPALARVGLALVGK